jgi:hypothetical protein
MEGFAMNFQWQEVIWGGLLFAAVLMLFLALGFYKSELDDASAHQDGSLVKTDKLLALPVASQIFAAPIAWVSMRINSFMSAGLTSKLNAKLVAAGLDGSLSALSFVAMKTLVFLIVSAILLLILLSRDDALGVQGLSRGLLRAQVSGCPIVG